jgi:ABC transporter transmembrane region
MFARVITAQAGTQGFDSFIRVAGEQLPGARQQPGFKGFYLLTDAESGKAITISLWETREQMEAVRGRPAGWHPGPGHPGDRTNTTAPRNLRSHDARLSHSPQRLRRLFAIGLQTYESTRVGQQVMRDLRDRLYAHLQTLPLAFFASTKTGEIQSRLANDVGGVQSVGTTTLSAANGRAGRADCRRSLRDVISSLALGKWPSGVCVRPPRQQSRVRELTNVQRTASCRKGRRSMTFACRSAPTSSMWRRGSAAASLEWSLSLE